MKAAFASTRAVALVLASLLSASLLLALLLPALPASALQIHAHRGGPVAEGVAAFGENSMPAFRNAAARGWVIELDLARTSDGVAVVMHDDSLSRTTDCEGDVAARTMAEIAGCRIDRIGIGDARQDLAPGDPRLSPVPTLADVLDLLEETGARANIEVKNLLEGDESFPPAVYAQIAASPVARRQVIVQNFLPPNLATVPDLLPGAQTSLLTLNFLNESLGFDWAVDGGYDWVSPEGPVTREYVTRAHSAGFNVVPWTVDDAEGLRAAAATAADAVITNDPALAERLVGPRPRLLLRALPRRLVLRPGRVTRVSARVFNRGDAASRPGRIQARPSGPAARLAGSGFRRIAAVPAGGVRTVSFPFRLKRRLNPGRRGAVRFTLSVPGMKPVAVTRPVTVRRR